VPIGKNKIIVLNIFKKKKQKTPRREIDIALKRYPMALDK